LIENFWYHYGIFVGGQERQNDIEYLRTGCPEQEKENPTLVGVVQRAQCRYIPRDSPGV